MNITKEDKERLQSKYDVICNKLARKPPSFVQTSEQLHQFALHLTALHEATQKTIGILIKNALNKVLAEITEYRDRGYPYGKTKRGLKKWMKNLC